MEERLETRWQTRQWMGRDLRSPRETRGQFCMHASRELEYPDHQPRLLQTERYSILQRSRPAGSAELRAASGARAIASCNLQQRAFSARTRARLA